MRRTFPRGLNQSPVEPVRPPVSLTASLSETLDALTAQRAVFHQDRTDLVNEMYRFLLQGQTSYTKAIPDLQAVHARSERHHEGTGTVMGAAVAVAHGLRQILTAVEVIHGANVEYAAAWNPTGSRKDELDRMRADRARRMLQAWSETNKVAA